MPIHKSHETRFSDSSSYDYKCIKCGETDISGAGWGKLAKPCRKKETVSVQACRPEDRAMLATLAGQDLVNAVSDAMRNQQEPNPMTADDKTRADEFRAEFEAWAIEAGFNINIDEFGKYKISNTGFAFIGWQAAMSDRAKQAGAGDAWQLITESLLAKQPEWLDGLLWISDGVRVWRGRYMWRQGHQPDRFVGEGGNIHAIGLYAAPDVTPKPPSESQPPTPQPEPKALEPVAPNIAHVASVVFDEGAYNVLFLETASQVRLTLHTAAQLNQARVEVAERCFKIAYSQADRIASMPPTENGDGGLWLQARYIADQIKQLADQMRGGE